MTAEEPSTSAAVEPTAPRPSDDSSNDDSMAERTDNAPPTYPKIPPPPSEHPPPYTPFGGQSATLLPQRTPRDVGNSASTAHNRNPHVIHPPGFRRYLQYLTVRNVVLAIVAILALALFVHIIAWSNRSDHEMNETGTLPGTKPLDVAWLGLGEYNKSLALGFRARLSYDESADKVILSQYHRNRNLLHCEAVDINDHLSGFKEFAHNISKTFAQCTCYTEHVYCCATDANSRHHQTECFLNENSQTIHSVAVMFNPSPDWQSLADGEKLLVLHNHQRNSLLDLRTRRVLKIEENRLPIKYVSIGFFFPMDSAEELEELVRSGEEFRICEHLRTGTGDYALKDELCTATPFTVEFELPKVKFCSNPLYTVVIQYGHLVGEPQTLTWHLRVKYDSSPDIYSASESFAAERDELVMDCNDREVDIFALGTHELNQYTITLPNLRSEHFIQTRAV